MVKKRVKGKSYSQFLFVLVVIILLVSIISILVYGLGEFVLNPSGTYDEVYELNTHVFIPTFNVTQIGSTAFTKYSSGNTFEFNLTISVFDSPNLTIANIVNYTGRSINITHNGSGVLSPTTLTGGFFDGINVTFYYNTSERNKYLYLNLTDSADIDFSAQIRVHLTPELATVWKFYDSGSSASLVWAWAPPSPFDDATKDVAILSSDNIYAVSSIVYRVDPPNKTPEWSYYTGSAFTSAVADGNNVYITGQQDEEGVTVRKWNSITDEVVWEFADGGWYTYMYDLADGGDFVYTVGTSYWSGTYGGLYKVNDSAGDGVWLRSSQNQFYSVTLDNDGNPIAAGSGGYAPYNIIKYYSNGTSAYSKYLNYIFVDIVYYDGYIYGVGTRYSNGSVWKLEDNQNFTTVWEYDTGATAESIAIGSSGEIYVVGEKGADNNTFWRLSDEGSSASKVWGYDTANFSDSPGEYPISVNVDNSGYIWATGKATVL